MKSQSILQRVEHWKEGAEVREVDVGGNPQGNRLSESSVKTQRQKHFKHVCGCVQFTLT